MTPAIRWGHRSRTSTTKVFDTDDGPSIYLSIIFLQQFISHLSHLISLISSLSSHLSHLIISLPSHHISPISSLPSHHISALPSHLISPFLSHLFHLFVSFHLVIPSYLCVCVCVYERWDREERERERERERWHEATVWWLSIHRATQYSEDVSYNIHL